MQVDNCKSELLRSKIAQIFDFVRDTVMSGTEPTFEVMNLEKMKGYTYDEDEHCLVLSERNI